MFAARSLEIVGIALVAVFAAPRSIAVQLPTTQQICYSGSVPLQQTSWTTNVPIQKFDPLLGTLTQIDFQLTGTESGIVEVESLDSSPTVCQIVFQSSFSLLRPDLSTLVVSVPIANYSFLFTAFDGTIDFAGTSGAMVMPTVVASSSVTSPPPASDLSMFTGAAGNPGTIALPIAAINSTYLNAPGNQTSLVQMQASADLQVCYTYVPNQAGSAYCFGDGSSTACPCGNVGVAGAGCPSSVNANGAVLSGAGVPSIAADTLVLQGSGMPDSAALYFQGTTQTDSVFGDGKRCAGGSIIRLGTKINSGGVSQYPTGAQATISVRGMNTAGAVRDYQVWYRNAAPAFCTPSTFNLTNGLNLTWLP